MQAYQREFIELSLYFNILRFGDFTLKSGRKSPYFFNSGLYNNGVALARCGRIYAQAISQANITYDMLFGPAYKGIPLVTSTAIALAEHYHHNVNYAFNRKETKDHGEKGNIIGAPLAGKVLLIDDVITAGTAFRESQQLIAHSRAQIVGIVIALDRQERGQNEKSTLDEIRDTYHIPVISIITLDDLITYLKKQNENKTLIMQIEEYRTKYGA